MPTQRPLLGAAIMVLSMCLFPVGDAATKYIGSDYPPIYLAWARFAVGALLLTSLVIISGSFNKKILTVQTLKEQTVRSLCILSATICFVISISAIPLADAFSAYMIGPIVAMILAVLVLKESITRLKVISALLGFAGAIIVINPSANMDVGYLFALAAGFSFGAYLVATRWAASTISPLLAAAFQTLFGTIVLAPFAWPLLFQINPQHLWLFAIIGGGSATANILAITASKHAPATLLAPLVYIEIAAATLLGFWVFGDIPLPRTWLGIAIIVLAGLMLIQRKRANTRRV